MGEVSFRCFPFLCVSGCCIICFFIFVSKNCHIAILIGYLIGYECVTSMAILSSSVLSAIYCHKNQRNIGVLEGFLGEN